VTAADDVPQLFVSQFPDFSLTQSELRRGLFPFLHEFLRPAVRETIYVRSGDISSHIASM
jgi:hypothetical protein